MLYLLYPNRSYTRDMANKKTTIIQGTIQEEKMIGMLRKWDMIHDGKIKKLFLQEIIFKIILKHRLLTEENRNSAREERKY